MRKTADYVGAMEDQFTMAARRQVLFLEAEDEALSGSTVRIGGRDLRHFGSCSYMGLELDERLKEGAIDAIRRYGTQFSASRGYLSLPLYGELEALLSEIFGGEVLVTPSTSLAHVSALPVLIEEGDAVILDQQVHASVQMAVNHVRVNGVPVSLVRHNRLDMLEDRVATLSHKHRRVWYMADGVYSMYGDFAPIAGLVDLLARYEGLHLYIDDAHAMSWCGTKGRGFALEALAGHPRVVVATSLNKAFASGGGALVVSDPALRTKLRTVGMPLIFSGPVQPPMLGAAVASARLHTSAAFPAMQAELLERIRLCNRLCRERGLPLVGPDDTPVRFIGTVQPQATFQLVNRLAEAGYYANGSFYPIVPMRRAGLRFTITRHHTESDIRGFVDAVAEHLPGALAEAGLSIEDAFRTFDLLPPVAALRVPEAITLTVSATPPLRLQHATTIAAIDAAEWDRLLGDRGTFDWEGLRFLEGVFRDHDGPGGPWQFHYFLVRDASDRPVLATFFTDAIWKDDMLAPPEVSRRLEAVRHASPMHMTTRVLGMGSMLTEGDHLYLDREADWQGAMSLLLEKVGQLAEAVGAPTIALRDLPTGDAPLAEFLAERDFVRFPMLEGHVVEDFSWENEAEFHARLSFKSRRHRQGHVVPWNDAYSLTILDHRSPRPEPALIAHLHGLYRAVQAQSFDLNVFPLPEELFSAMLDSPRWEFLVLHLKPEHGGKPGGLPVAFAACFKGAGHYVPHVCGLDYEVVRSHGAYRQLLRHCVLRAKALGATRLELGLGAALEKRRVGAVERRQDVYVQNTDAFQAEVLAELMGEARRSGRA